MNKEKPKIEYDKNTLCKCGKPAPIMPYYCEVCKRGSMKGKEIKVVGFVKTSEMISKKFGRAIRKLGE